MIEDTKDTETKEKLQKSKNILEKLQKIERDQHIKDQKEIGASGLLDFKPIYEARAKAGTKYSIVEVERYDFEPLVSAQKSYDFLNNASFVK